MGRGRDIAAVEELGPHVRVRVVFPGAIIHLAARQVPRVVTDDHGQVVGVTADWIIDPRYGDAPVHIDWLTVCAVTWRDYTKG